MYQLTQLFLYRPLFMAELLIAELLFCSQLPKRKNFILRLILGMVACFGVSLLFPVPDFAYTAAYSSFMFLTLFAVTVVAFKFVFDADVKDVLFCTIAGYTVQHVAQEAYELLNVAFNLNDSIVSIFYSNAEIGTALGEDLGKTFGIVFMYGALFLFSYWGAYLIFVKKMKKTNILHIKTTMMLIVVALIVFVDIIFSAIITYNISEEIQRLALLLLHLYNLACCILALILLFEWPNRKAMEWEIATMKQLRHHEKEQYHISKENVELINIKCHDLKHQLRQVAEHNAVNSSVVKEMEEIISIYDSTYTTQNEALNVILMEKGLVCNRKGIKLSCIVDGQALRFMSEADVYALFGNLLDNAIEAVEKTEDEKRSIALSVKTVQGFVNVSAYNYYDGDLRFESGLPVTTKKEKDFHGYGLKSMRYIVNKYGGEMKLYTEQNRFGVNIILPVRENV